MAIHTSADVQTSEQPCMLSDQASSTSSISETSANTYDSVTSIETPICLTVAICGAGLVGLTLAALLSQEATTSVELYEKKSEIDESGHGIGIWKSTWEMLDETLAFGKAAVKAQATTPGWEGVKGAVLRKSDIAGGNSFFRLNHGFKSLSRKTVLDILRAKIDETRCKIFTNRKVSGYSDIEDKPVLHFVDAPSRTFDVIIGADGILSRIRTSMYANDSTAEDTKPQFSGEYAHRMIVLKKDLASINPTHPGLEGFVLYCGKNKRVISNAVGPYIFSTAYTKTSPLITPPWTSKTPTSTFIHEFSTWEPAITQFLTLAPTSDRWAVYTIPPLPYIHKTHTAIIGDAAHAMLPHQGLGAGQGMEDAYVLWRLLREPGVTRENVGFALEVYGEVRRGEASAAAESSERMGSMADFTCAEQEGWGLEEVGRAMDAQCEWLGEGGRCFRVGERAVGALKERLEGRGV